MFPWQPAWSEELKNMATQQLSIVDPEVGLFFTFSGKRFVNEAAESCLSATSSVVFFRYVYTTSQPIIWADLKSGSVKTTEQEWIFCHDALFTSLLCDIVP